MTCSKTVVYRQDSSHVEFIEAVTRLCYVVKCITRNIAKCHLPNAKLWYEQVVLVWCQVTSTFDRYGPSQALYCIQYNLVTLDFC